ncbi:MAG: hypothetical protein Q4A28_04995 [Brachymonas sp.]|nr:hypothetical protein [Brachymonas sp.]
MKPLAPAPVHYRLASGGGLLLALAALLLALGGVLLAWLLALRQAQQAGVAVIGLATAAAYALASRLSWRAARALPRGWLVWNGKVWQWQAPEPLLPTLAQQASQASASHGPNLESAGLERAGEPLAQYASCALALDLQRAVLLRLHGPLGQGIEPGAAGRASRSRWSGWRQARNDAAASAVWVWASRASDPAHWHALRCALLWAHGRQAAATGAVAQASVSREGAGAES